MLLFEILFRRYNRIDFLFEIVGTPDGRRIFDAVRFVATILGHEVATGALRLRERVLAANRLVDARRVNFEIKRRRAARLNLENRERKLNK